MLGDGNTIKISSDRWLRGKGEVIVDQLSTTEGRSAKVCDFFSEDRKSWNEAKVRMHFNTEDAQAILDTRIPHMCTKDRIAWLHSPNGQYTVKTGYQQWHKNHIGDLGLQHSKGWNKIWTMKIPHKIKFFLWRICRNNLPVRILLRGRGVRVPIVCSQCVGEVEHLLHLFFDCQFARECWQKVGLDYRMWEVESASDWLLDKLCNETLDNVIKIATVLWGVWFARNKRIFEGRNMSPTATICWSSKQIVEWRLANTRRNQIHVEQSESKQQHIQRWKPPETGDFKINVDASVVEGLNSYAVGMVLRNHRGDYISCKTMRFTGEVQVVEAEMVAILEAMLWLEELHLGSVKVAIESDSLLSVMAINKNNENYLELGSLIQHCRVILQARDGISVSYVRKRANKLAHEMAKIPCEPSSFIVSWSPPSFLLGTILSDMC